MAPKKSPSSSASTRKSTHSSPTKSLHSSSSSKSDSPTKIMKTSPQKKLPRTKAQQLAESIEGTITPQRHSSSGGGKHAHFDKHVYPQNEGPEDLANTEEATPKAPVQKPTPNPKSKRISTPRPTRHGMMPLPQISAEPNKPSYEGDFLEERRHARNKPDPAKGDSYEIIHGDEVVFDERETPGYLNHYQDLFVELCDVQTRILAIAKDHFSYSIAVGRKKEWLVNLDENMSEELQRYVGFLAVGGPCAIPGWEELLLEPQLRSALAAALIWKALKQHVFNKLWFGATASQVTELQNREEDLKREECGFERSKKRAELLRSEKNGPWRKTYHVNVEEEKVKLAAGIYGLLDPLLDQASKHQYEADLLTKLLYIIGSSVKLHHSMHLDGTSVYQWAATLKDWPYDSKVLRVTTQVHWNWLFDPQNRSAYTEADPENGLDKHKTERVHRYGFLSRIVVFEPLEVYRTGGWRKDSEQIGQRKKLIIKGAVACRWGAVRRYGTKAKPGEGDFRELRECRRRLGRGDQWWLSAPNDPATSAKNVPVLGLKGKGLQSKLEGFKPSAFATIS